MPLHVESAGLSKHRLEALADGIFAIALTLLVLDLRLPALASFWPSWNMLAMLPMILLRWPRHR